MGLLLLCLGLYLPPAASLGLWEPWETAPATLARRLVQRADVLSPFALVGDEGLMGRPWLQAVLLKLGYLLGGGSEAGLRLPLVLVTTLSALGSYGCLRLLFPAWRAGLVIAAMIVSPMTLLGATNLAGYAYAHAPITLTMVAMATVSTRPGRWSIVLVPLIGLGLGMSVWGLGLLGWAVPVTALAVFAAGARGEAPSLATAIGLRAAAMVVLGVCVIWPLLNTLLLGMQAPLADGETTRTLAQSWVTGWNLAKDSLGAALTFGLPLAALLLAVPGSRASWLLHPLHAGLAVGLFAAVVIPPAVALVQTAALMDLPAVDAAARTLMYGSMFVERTYAEHVTFDIIIRVVGFSVYPLICLVPAGFGYLLHVGEGDDDRAPADSAFRMFLAVWVAVGFGICGLGATLAHHFAFSFVFPLVAAPVLALTDANFMRYLRSNRLAFYAAGLGSFFILAVMTKDIRGHLDKEAGQAGPLVMYELLLADGSEEFPSSYVLQHINFFVVSWLLVLMAFFARPVVNLALLGRALEDTPSGWLPRRFRSVDATVAAAARLTGTFLVAMAMSTSAVWNRTAGRIGPPPVLTIGTFLTLIAAWNVHLAWVDVPEMTEHFSQKTVLQTWERFADEGENLHVVGIDEDDNSYYMGADSVTRLSDMGDLRTLFCETGDARVFAVVPTPRLSEAWFQIRRPREASQDEECPPQPAWVLYGRSSRYALISNQLDPAAGEVHEGFIAENVYTSEDALPADVDRVPAGELTVDGKLELVGYRVTPRSLGHGPVQIESYWRVLEPPPSGYQAFIHVDYDGNRINGDHPLVGGNFPLNHWVVGDIVRDSHTVEFSRADKAGEYTVFFGFWRGDDRLAATGERASSDNRIRLGTVQIAR